MRRYPRRLPCFRDAGHPGPAAGRRRVAPRRVDLGFAGALINAPRTAAIRRLPVYEPLFAEAEALRHPSTRTRPPHTLARWTL